jgi:hypothetical protein
MHVIKSTRTKRWSVVSGQSMRGGTIGGTAPRAKKKILEISCLWTYSIPYNYTNKINELRENMYLFSRGGFYFYSLRASE